MAMTVITATFRIYKQYNTQAKTKLAKKSSSCDVHLVLKAATLLPSSAIQNILTVKSTINYLKPGLLCRLVITNVGWTFYCTSSDMKIKYVLIQTNIIGSITSINI